MISIAQQATDSDVKSRRRRSIFETSMLSGGADSDTDAEVVINVDSGDIVSPSEVLSSSSAALSAAARHINSRRPRRLAAATSGGQPMAAVLVRSTSLRENHRRSGSWSGFEPIQRTDGEDEEEEKVEGAC